MVGRGDLFLSDKIRPSPEAPSPEGRGLVSVVIPTLNRPEAVCRAVASVQAQTYRNLEIIVVVDGDDPPTVTALAALNEPRLKVVVHGKNKGPGAARNTGVEYASGRWVAFLDDDDEWLPPKLEVQVAAAEALRDKDVVVTCRVFAEFGGKRMVWPNRMPKDGQHLSEYLIDRPRLISRPGYVATPTILINRELAREIPFPDDEDHEDWGWLLLLADEAGARVHFVWEPLAIVKISPTLTSRSHRNEWQVSFEWAQRYRSRMTGVAFASFVLTKVAGRARRAGAWGALPKILLASFRMGTPRPRHLAFFAGTWLLPPSGLRKVFNRALSWG